MAKKNVTLASAESVDRTKSGKRKYKKNVGLTIILVAATFFFILTSSIAFPILCKEFYYCQIDNLNLVKTSGLSEEQIRTAYSEVIDYCIGLSEEFSVGELSYSIEGMEHFADCRNLFILDLGVLAVSTVTLVVWLLIRGMVSMRAKKWKDLSPAFWGAALLMGAFIVIAGLASINFDQAFVIFHKIFFPGKSNWLFDPRVDQVITILPEDFFMRCGIVIVGLIFVQCLVCIIVSLIARKKQKK